MAEEETLDPNDWEEIRRVFHSAADHGLAHMRDVRERPVWQPTPEAIQERFRERLPRDGQPVGTLLSCFEDAILPYGTGNTHPRFWGWVHGSGNVAGVLGEMLAAFMNCNAGGRDHIATYVERQVVDWSKEIFAFPATASGILTSGTSMATLIALAVARDAKADADVQKRGVAAAGTLVGYASVEAHRSIAKSFDLLGLGSEALRLVPVDGDDRMRVDRLAEMVEADRAADACHSWWPPPREPPTQARSTTSKASRASAGQKNCGCTWMQRSAGWRSSRPSFGRNWRRLRKRNRSRSTFTNGCTSPMTRAAYSSAMRPHTAGRFPRGRITWPDRRRDSPAESRGFAISARNCRAGFGR